MKRPLPVALGGRSYLVHPDGTVYDASGRSLRRVRNPLLVNQIIREFNEKYDYEKLEREHQMDRIMGMRGE